MHGDKSTPEIKFDNKFKLKSFTKMLLIMLLFANDFNQTGIGKPPEEKDVAKYLSSHSRKLLSVIVG